MISDADCANIATFVHRYALKHVRTYQHPIERVWQAVIEPVQLAAWYVPNWEIEPYLGGRWSCSFGNPDALTQEGAEAGFGHGVILAWEPPRLVDYGGQLRFELEEVDGGTRLTFIQTYPPNVRFPKVEASMGFENPVEPGYPIFPGAQAGNHLAMDDLALHLAGKSTSSGRELWLELTNAYHLHFRDRAPGARVS